MRFCFIVLLLILAGYNPGQARQYSPSFPDQTGDGETLTMKIVPVGWGPQGLLAFRQETHNPWAPSDGERFVIYSLVDDKVVWEHSYEIFAGEEEDSGVRARQSRQAFDDEIKKRGITPGDSDLEAFPYYDRGSALEVYLDIPSFSSEQGFCTTYHAYDYTVMATKGGRKKKISQGQNTMVISQTILGYLKHPREDRIAVIVLTYYAGIECEHFYTTDIIGCHTRAGFK